MKPARLLWPIPGRIILAGGMLVLAAGRLGLYRHASGTLVSDYIYGLLIVLCAAGLIATEGKLSLRWPGRTAAALSSGLLAGMAIDLILTAGYLTTSSLMIVWFSFVLIVQAGARREC